MSHLRPSTSLARPPSQGERKAIDDGPPRQRARVADSDLAPPKVGGWASRRARPSAGPSRPPVRQPLPAPPSTTVTEDEDEVDDLLLIDDPTERQRRNERKRTEVGAPTARAHTDLTTTQTLQTPSPLVHRPPSSRKLGPGRPLLPSVQSSTNRAPTVPALSLHSPPTIPAPRTVLPPSARPPIDQLKIKKKLPIISHHAPTASTSHYPLAAVAPPFAASPPSFVRPIEKSGRGPSDKWDIKILCWNVKGLGKILAGESGKAFEKVINKHEPDILVLTNHHVRPQSNADTSFFKTKGYRRLWWNNAVHEYIRDEGDLGVVIMSKCRYPLHVEEVSIIGAGQELQGRYMQVEFDSFVLIATLFPNSETTPHHQERKEIQDWHRKVVAGRTKFHRQVTDAVAGADKVMPVILTGSFATDLDEVAKRSHAPSSDGFYPSIALANIFSAPTRQDKKPLVDLATRFVGPIKIEREVWQAEAADSVTKRREWTYKHARAGPVRLDGFMVSQRLLPRVQAYHVLDVAEAISSPHRPVLIQLKAAEELAGG